MSKGQPKSKQQIEVSLTELRAREQARREAVRSSATAVDSSATAVPATSAPQTGLLAPPSSPLAKADELTGVTTLVSPDEAISLVETRLPSIFVAMVEQRQGLLEALKLVGLPSATFFTALDASQNLRAWYRGVKAAQATMDIEGADQVLREMDDDAGDEGLGNGVRNAKMQAAKLKLDQFRWMAQRLLPAMFGDKSTTEIGGKVEIVVRREAKKVVQQVEVEG